VIPLLAALLAVFQSAPPDTPPVPAAAYVPQRVFDTHRRAFSDFEQMLADAAAADVVFVGEEHDSANTHRLELAVLEGLRRRHKSLVLAMEMFERDAQPALEDYLSGAATEQQFLASARPWPRYATDYRPSVEFAREHHIPVVASNVPRRIASDVSKNGLDAVGSLGDERRLVAAELECPTSGDYYDRFLKAMTDHTASNPQPSTDLRARNDRYYLAQCVKDETMGESVAGVVLKSREQSSTVVHYNGSFHSDFAEGTVASTARRLPGRRLIVVSIVTVPDMDAVAPAGDDLRRADYVVYTLK
jgi:uncharacterized iron-regulated protein